jgi:hypothetical protein
MNLFKRAIALAEWIPLILLCLLAARMVGSALADADGELRRNLAEIVFGFELPACGFMLMASGRLDEAASRTACPPQPGAG